MKRLTINKPVNVKWLTLQLQAVGVDVISVGVQRDEEDNFISAYVEIAEADEALALTVIEAHDPANTPDVLEKVDFESLRNDTTNQLDWITVTIPEIDNGLAAVGAFTNATQRAIVTGLLQNQKRELQIIRGILRAIRFVARKLIGG